MPFEIPGNGVKSTVDPCSKLIRVKGRLDPSDSTAAFTISPEPWASLCCANSPGNLALYAVSVHRLIALHSGFFQTEPHDSALAFG